MKRMPLPPEPIVAWGKTRTQLCDEYNAKQRAKRPVVPSPRPLGPTVDEVQRAKLSPEAYAAWRAALRAHAALIARAKEHPSEPMSAADFRLWIYGPLGPPRRGHRLSGTQTHYAKQLGLSLPCFEAYLYGQRPIPPKVAHDVRRTMVPRREQRPPKPRPMTQAELRARLAQLAVILGTPARAAAAKALRIGTRALGTYLAKTPVPYDAAHQLRTLTPPQPPGVRWVSIERRVRIPTPT